MNLEEALATRRTIQEFSDASIDLFEVEQALRYAQWAPNHRTNWPWRFYWCGPKTRQKLANVAVAIKQAKSTSELTPSQIASAQRDVLAPAVLLAFTALRDNQPGVALENQFAVACAMQNTQLYLHSKGIGAKWKTGALPASEATAKALGYSTEVEQMVGFLYVGAPARVPTAPQRPPLDRVLQKLP